MKKTVQKKSRRVEQTAVSTSSNASFPATRGTYPSPDPADALSDAFHERLAENYEANKRWVICCLKDQGVRDPEAAYQDAFKSTIKSAKYTRRDIEYLWNRIRSRLLTAEEAHGRYRDRFEVKDDEFWAAYEPVVTADEEREAKIELVREMLSRLPEQTARVLKLKYMEGYSIKEICACEGLTEGALKSRLQRGRELALEILLAIEREDSRNLPDKSAGYITGGR